MTTLSLHFSHAHTLFLHLLLGKQLLQYVTSLKWALGRTFILKSYNLQNFNPSSHRKWNHEYPFSLKAV